jgi:hypothetical protein
MTFVKRIYEKNMCGPGYRSCTKSAVIFLIPLELYFRPILTKKKHRANSYVEFQMWFENTPSAF